MEYMERMMIAFYFLHSCVSFASPIFSFTIAQAHSRHMLEVYLFLIFLKQTAVWLMEQLFANHLS
jgi:hypothetical protein